MDSSGPHRAAPRLAAAAPRAGDRSRFPEIDGRRSTTATTRAILADAARAADPALAARIEACENWRSGYVAAAAAS